jgi:hypothetical protein
VVLNAALWICKAEVPQAGVASAAVTDAELKETLDPKKPRKK